MKIVSDGSIKKYQTYKLPLRGLVSKYSLPH